MKGVPLYLRAAPLDPAFTGDPQAFFDELVRRLRIVSPDGFYGVIVSDTEPTSNQGVWLKDGTKIYVWSDVERRYVPADITDSLRDVYTALTSILSRLGVIEGKLASGRVIYSRTAPAEADRANVLWVQVDADGRVLEVKSWDSTTNTWTPAKIAADYELTGGVVNAYTIRLNSPNSMAELVGRHLSLKFHVGCTAASTLQVIGFDPVPLKKRKNEDLEDGDFKTDQITSVWYDGAVFQLVSTKAPVIPHIPDTPSCEYKVITIPCGPLRINADGYGILKVGLFGTLGVSGDDGNVQKLELLHPHGMVGAPTRVEAKLITRVFTQGTGSSGVLSVSQRVDIYPGAHIPLPSGASGFDESGGRPVLPTLGIGWDQTNISVLDFLACPLLGDRFVPVVRPHQWVSGTPREPLSVPDHHAGYVQVGGMVGTPGTGISDGDYMFTLELHCFRYFTP